MVENFFDPNTWENVSLFEYRVYADDYANEYAIVDQVDYQYLIQWRWKLKQSRTWLGTKKPKVYLARSGHETLAPTTYDEEGKRVRSRIVATIFLHTLVMERKGTPKPISNQKIIVDHANSNSFDCRRHNLRYATIGFNNKNKHGVHESMLIHEGEYQC